MRRRNLSNAQSPCIPNRAAQENKHEYENDAVQRKINNSENVTTALTRRWRAYGSERIWQDVLPQVGDGWMPADCARHSSHSHRTVMTSLLMASDLIMTDRNTCLPRSPPSPTDIPVGCGGVHLLLFLHLLLLPRAQPVCNKRGMGALEDACWVFCR